MAKDVRSYVRFLEYKFTTTRTDRITSLTDHHVFCDDMARAIGCRPDLGIRRLLTEPRIWLRCMLGPLSIVQYRLEGPHAHPKEARRMLSAMAWCPDMIVTVGELFFFYLSFILWWVFRIKKFRPLTWYPIKEWESED